MNGYNISSIMVIREHLDIIALVLLWIFRTRPYYLLIITTNAGEMRLLKSKDLDRLSLIKDIISMAMSQCR